MLGKKEFNIPVTVGIHDEEDNPIKQLYNGYVLLVSSMFKLTPKQATILAELLFQNYMLLDRVQDEKLRWNVIMDSDNRRHMMERIKVGRQTFLNSITELRKKDILKGNRVIPNLIVYPENGLLQIHFNFKVEK
mgnify:CR=1 FL=1